jgi:sugar phosphate isomerase/epimerase
MAFVYTGFADEISPDLGVQVDTMSSLGIKGIDLRSVGGVNVLQLTDNDLKAVREKCEQFGLHVSCIGSPVNKVGFTLENRPVELEKLKKAIHAAKETGTDRIRLFTPETDPSDDAGMAQGVLDWMREQKQLAADHGMILLHENDAKFWGAYPANAKILFAELGGENFRAAFDFANTVHIGFRPMNDWFPWLLPHLHTLHMKDAVAETGKVVPVGEGDGQCRETLTWLLEQGWSGPLTLEPHLQAAGAYGGFSGPQLFEVAASAMKSTFEAVQKA